MKTIDLVAFKDPKSPVSEVYRTLRTNIKFASFEREIKTIAITSTGPNEGKSTVTSNLGIIMAQSGHKVLIMEGDLRNPTIHKYFNLTNRHGLTNLMVEDAPYKDYLRDPEIQNLDILTGGPTPPNPAEILGSLRARKLIETLRQDYDYVLIDTPPLALVTDAALVASICDGTILVVGAGETVSQMVVKTRDLLDKAKANILGVVLNKVRRTKSDRYYYYYHDYYSEDSSGTGKKISFKRRTMDV
jgi:capsular exopolysaccharide synthesis family protein